MMLTGGFADTHSKALADGALVDASTLARKGGILVPVALNTYTHYVVSKYSTAATDPDARILEMLRDLSRAMNGATVEAAWSQLPIRIERRGCRTEDLWLLVDLENVDGVHPAMTVRVWHEDR